MWYIVFGLSFIIVAALVVVKLTDFMEWISTTRIPDIIKNILTWIGVAIVLIIMWIIGG